MTGQVTASCSCGGMGSVLSFFPHFYYVCVSVHTHACTWAHIVVSLWRSEDNSQDSVLRSLLPSHWLLSSNSGLVASAFTC